MADFDVQVAMQGISELPEDRYVNTLHFSGEFGGSEADELFTKYDEFFTTVGGGIAADGHTISVYAPGPNPGGPLLHREYARAGGGGGPLSSQGPAEVALCLSYAAVDDPEASLPRRRGRIYLGPIKGPNVGEARPGATVRGAALTLGQGIAQVGTALTTTWVMLSRTDGSYHKIEVCWVDDSWDTVRRRGLAPTQRFKQDVQ